MSFLWHLGHDVKNCAKHFAATKIGGTVDYQYGNFLKAMGGRARGGPFERKTGGAEYGQEGGGETSNAGSYKSKGGPIRCEVQLQLSRDVAVADGQCRNPRNNDEGQSEFSRIKLHVQEPDHTQANYVVSSTADVHKAVTELKENSIQVVDGLPSGLEGKTEESNMMGLSGTEAI